MCECVCVLVCMPKYFHACMHVCAYVCIGVGANWHWCPLGLAQLLGLSQVGWDARYQHLVPY